MLAVTWLYGLARAASKRKGERLSEWRARFLSALTAAGLQLEQRVVDSGRNKLTFVKAARFESSSARHEAQKKYLLLPYQRNHNQTIDVGMCSPRSTRPGRCWRPRRSSSTSAPRSRRRQAGAATGPPACSPRSACPTPWQRRCQTRHQTTLPRPSELTRNGAGISINSSLYNVVCI